MTLEGWIALGFGAMIAVVILILGYTIVRQHKQIDRQNDTIQRLINREPVTYAETGQQPAKKQKEVYAAWGAQMVNLDEDGKQ